MRLLKKFSGKEFSDVISIIIPLYKSFDPLRIQISIDSLKQQQKANLEIVVVEQADRPSFDVPSGIVYDVLSNKEVGDHEYAIPGSVRNRAAKLSSGKYLYNSDGDIVYHNPFYFAEILELIKTGKDVALYRPPMRRLPLEEFNSFRNIWKERGLQEALDCLDMSDEFTAKIPGSQVSILSFRKKESGRLKTFLYSSTDLKKYMEDSKLKGSEPKYFTLSVHAGGTFMERRHFWDVGGFCEKFIAWGCHDADLQWKLRARFNLIEFPNFPEYEVLHLDHERGYFDKERWQINRQIQQSRRELGVNLAISEDLEHD
ncbi:MAG: glycosyltransferase family 2 protein [archaeon]|nr:glycosyltransferase family 2 protein [archaeon]